MNLNQYSGMYGNVNQMQAIQHAPDMGFYQGSLLKNQQQPHSQSIYAQFAPMMPNSSCSVNQPLPMGYSSQPPTENSIYPNHSVIDKSICINSPLPLKPGAPVATVPNQRGQRNRNFSSNLGLLLQDVWVCEITGFHNHNSAVASLC